MSQNVIIGGDFRKLLNALSNVDEVTLGEILPFRKGSKGLHLVEALGQSTRLPSPLPKAREASVWFADDFAQLRRDFTDGTGVERQLGVLGNVPLEKAVADLIRQLIKPGSGAPKVDAEPGKSGFFRRFFKK
jgi:hypothetical protein